MVIGVACFGAVGANNGLLRQHTIVFIVGVGNRFRYRLIGISRSLACTVAIRGVGIRSYTACFGFRQQSAGFIVGILGGIVVFRNRCLVSVSKVGCTVVFYDRTVLGIGLSGDILIFATESNMSDYVVRVKNLLIQLPSLMR